MVHRRSHHRRQRARKISRRSSLPRRPHFRPSILQACPRYLLPRAERKVKGVGEILEGLIPYSQRHFSRIDRLQRSAYLLDYTLEGMSVIEPETSEIESSKDKHMENSWGADHEQFSEEKTKEDTMEIPTKKRKSGKLEEIKSSKDKYAEISLGAETAADEKKEETEEPAKDISARKQKKKRKSGKAGNDKKVKVISSMMSSIISAEA